MTPDTHAQHVVPHEGKWGVRAENSEKPSKLFETKLMAAMHAFDIADNNDGKIVVHGKDGTIQTVEKTENTNKLMAALKTRG